MRITKISARDWLGKFNFDMTFDNDDHIEIITGPNAYGKTLLLTHYLYHLCAGDKFQYSYNKYDFESISILYDTDRQRSYLNVPEADYKVRHDWTDDVKKLTVVPLSLYYKILYLDKPNYAIIKEFNERLSDFEMMSDFKFGYDENNYYIKLYHHDYEFEPEQDTISSGQMQLLKILSTLLFAKYKNADIITMDDVGENLHVVIQHNLISMINELKDKDTQVILSTHSPTVIGSRWNQCHDIYELNEQYKNGTDN